MANKDDRKPAIATNTRAVAIPLKDIHVDYTWNARSKANVISETSLGAVDTSGKLTAEGNGLQGLLTSMPVRGQDTAVVVRPTPAGAKNKEPYQLVAGFRRYTSIVMLNEAVEKKGKGEDGKIEQAVANVPNGHILADIVVLDDTEARLRNGRENTERDNLTTPDLCFLVRDLTSRGLTQQAISTELGIVQGYVSKLSTIATLPPAVLSHWRERTELVPGEVTNTAWRQCTTDEMVDLAKIAREAKMAADDTVERYISMVKPTDPDAKKRAAELKKAEKIETNVKEAAEFIASLVHAGFVKQSSMNWSEIIGPKFRGFVIDAGNPDAPALKRLTNLATKTFAAKLEALEKSADGVPAGAAAK